MKLIGGLFIIVIIAGAGIFAINHFYPEKLPKNISSIINHAEKTGMNTIEDVIPGYATDAERKMKAQIEENARIANEEREKLQRLGQQKAEYEFNKAFEEWYVVPEDCLTTKNSRTISLCVNAKRSALEEFTAIWNNRKQQ